MYSLYRWRWNPENVPVPKVAGPTFAAKTPAKCDTRQLALHAISIVLLSLAISSLANGAYIHAKASLAQWLIGQAWQQARTLEHSERNMHAVPGTSASKPWPWADTWPVARLQYAKANKDLYILAGAQGNSLAFGPGHLFGSALPGTTGVSVVGGHRDTHFAFLQHLQPGDELQVTPANGAVQRYTVTNMQVADSLAGPLLATPYASQLLLVTCYPFDAVASGPLRYVVTAQLQQPAESQPSTKPEMTLHNEVFL